MSWLVLALENLFFPLGSLGVVAKFLFSPRRGVLRSLRDELCERFGGVPRDQLAKLDGREILWVHAASAGEVAAVAELLKRIKAAPNPPAILMTTTTMTGRDRARELPQVDAATLAPLDCYPAVSRFLSAVEPAALLIVETELWPQTLSLASARGVRIGMVNGRMTERSFGRYLVFSSLARPFLAKIERLCAQTEADAHRFRSVGADPAAVRVVGNMKYDKLAAPAKDAELSRRLSKIGWGSAPIWVAGSTHPVEEDALIASFLEVRKKFPGLKLALAPRHPERASDALRSLQAAKIDSKAWSSADDSPCDCLLIDGLGVLPKLYPFASVAFVGGTLVPVGGHNLLEPAMAGSPVLFGPHTEHTAAVARLLESSGCGFCVEDKDSLSARLTDLLSDEKRCRALGDQARKVAEGLRGAIDRTLAHVGPILP